LGVIVAAKVGDPLSLYVVTATVIPVLLIAMVFEAKALEPFSKAKKPDVGEGKLAKVAIQTDAFSEIFGGIVILTAAIIGESASLRVLALQEPSSAARYYATGALIFLAFGVVARPVIKAIEVLEPTLFRVVVYVGILVFLYVGARVGTSVR
jgi:hypothetical protein